MGVFRNFFQSLHHSTSRDYVGRMMDDKVHCMEIARRYGFDFFDGERRYGFGGYHYDGRWLTVAQTMSDTYCLEPSARVLEVGCGKGYLLYEFTRAVENCQVKGFDISRYAVANGKREITNNIFVHRAEDIPWPFTDQEFDLVYSIATLHNLPVYDLKKALSEMDRVSKNSYLCVESYRNEAELFALQCWSLTCESFFSEKEWLWLYDEFGYHGDYEFIHFR
jgi:ubiquinone/menaquinone biosynthesis C-methylase UbiE